MMLDSVNDRDAPIHKTSSFKHIRPNCHAFESILKTLIPISNKAGKYRFENSRYRDRRRQATSDACYVTGK